MELFDSLDPPYWSVNDQTGHVGGLKAEALLALLTFEKEGERERLFHDLKAMGAAAAGEFNRQREANSGS